MREGRVLAVRRAWPGAVELDVTVDGAAAVALAYPALVGDPEPGDRALLNTTAVALGLGTGGYHLVVALPDRPPPDAPPAGHLVKARYTPLQATVLGVSEPASPWSAALAAATSVDGMPVVVADLHSALPAVLAGIAERRPGTRVAYVMTDGGALPLWFSRTVAAVRPALAGTVTAGQAFGGDLEAVTLHEALLAARVALGAEVAVVTQGPGNLGVGTPWGFSGVAAGDAVNAVAAVGGRPVASLRISAADPRERHRGVSHHSRTAYGRVALARADVVVPDLPEPLAGEVAADLRDSGIAARHDVVRVDATGLREALRDSGFPLSTMGRGLDEDEAYFVAAAAAGRHAAGLL
ncbi:MAG TPA: DUF3866 family protein [Mycobacteriales bacterium]|jgi:hypothetical protein|nr:DUF3866 family protein [Mycobacteriales bacterium]